MHVRTRVVASAASGGLALALAIVASPVSATTPATSSTSGIMAPTAMLPSPTTDIQGVPTAAQVAAIEELAPPQIAAAGAPPDGQLGFIPLSMSEINKQASEIEASSITPLNNVNNCSGRSLTPVATITIGQGSPAQQFPAGSIESVNTTLAALPAWVDPLVSGS